MFRDDHLPRHLWKEVKTIEMNFYWGLPNHADALEMYYSLLHEIWFRFWFLQNVKKITDAKICENSKWKIKKHPFFKVHEFHLKIKKRERINVFLNVIESIEICQKLLVIQFLHLSRSARTKMSIQKINVFFFTEIDIIKF